jgi:hypothetical protein
LLPHFLTPGVLGGCSLVCLLGGLRLLKIGSRNQRKYDYLKDPPHVWITGMPRGLVHVRGKVMVKEPLLSPLTQTPCAYYQTTLAREDPGKPGQFKAVCSESKESEFVIDDGTGKLLVMPAGAEYNLLPTYSGELDLKHSGVKSTPLKELGRQSTAPREEQLRRYLAGHGIGAAGEAASKRGNGSHGGGAYQLTETCLECGQEISVFGTCDVCFDPQHPRGTRVLCQDEHLPTFLITHQIVLPVGKRLRVLAIAGVTGGVLLIGLALAGISLLIYPHMV